METPARNQRLIPLWERMFPTLRVSRGRTIGTALLILALAAPIRAGSILREVFEGISGNAISDLTSSPDYPNNPSFTELVTDFFEAPTDVLEQYGQRLHGYIVPPVTGNYTFWIASDDNGSLLLSTDETPAKARQIAQVPEWTSSRQWDKYPQQQSAPINLQANKPYYISALMKEGGGGDNLAVGWLRPGGVDERPIPATYLLPWGTAFTPPAISQQPTNTTAIEGQLATFVVKVTNVDPVSVQWRRNGADIPSGIGFVLNYGPVTLADEGANFGAVLTNRIGSTNSTLATLHVLPDTTKPVLVSAVNLGADRIQVVFSEPVEAASANLGSNYSVSGGIGVTSATVDTDPRIVVLTVNPLTFAQNYTVTVRGIRDRAHTPNTVIPESATSFLALELVSQGIGLSGGSITRLGSGGFQVTGAGSGANGASDEVQFAWEQRTGNFDVRVRVDNVGV
ncbi:MAG TPA: PA14 domain-containing protein, partial [Verrucomicrobiota bacterium]|nr:PA14 domain-containing protein [Verrucomicrobiota bacterium]